MNKLKIMDSKTVGFLEKFFNENGPTVAAFGGGLCVAVAIFAAYKASKDIVDSNNQFEADMQQIEAKAPPEEEKKEAIKKAKSSKVVRNILAYKWVGSFGLLAIVLILTSNYLNGGKIAGLTMALAASEDKIKKGIKNAKETIGEEKLNEIKDKTYEDLIMKNFSDSNGFQAIKLNPRNGQIFLDGVNGYLFVHEKNELIEALEDAKQQAARNHGFSTDEYYEKKLGIMPGEDYVNKWWGPLNPFDYQIRTVYVMGICAECIEFEHDPVISKVQAGIPGGKY